MIKSIHTKNWLSHKDTRIELHPGLNVIRGSSDKGKSALFRSIIWAIMNEPKSKEFESWWGGNPEVVIGLEEGTLVQRLRTKSKNQYFLHSPDMKEDEEPLKFDSVGKGGIPDEIQAALNIDTDISIRDQGSNYFLLSETPSERARILNKAVKLDIIDISMSRINSKQHEAREALKGKREDLTKVTSDLEGLKGLDALDGKVAAAEVLEKGARGARTQAKGLEALLTDHGRVKEGLQEARPMAGLGPRVEGLVEKQEGLRELEEEAEQLRVHVSGLKKAQAGLEIAKAISGLGKKLYNIERKQDELERVEADIQTLTQHINSLGGVRGKRFETEKELERLQNKWDELMPSTCPLCHRGCDCG